LEDRYNAIIKKGLPKKSKDPGSFNLPVPIGALFLDNALLDLGGKRKYNSFGNAEENR